MARPPLTPVDPEAMDPEAMDPEAVQAAFGLPRALQVVSHRTRDPVT